MNDPRSIANNVTRWTGLGVKLPKELAGAVELFETLTYTEVSYPAAFDIDGVTANNAEQKIREFADQLVMAETNGGLSPLEKAKKVAVDAAARRVNSQARLAIPDLIEQLTPGFDELAQAYVEAVSKLPEDLTADALVSAGAEAVTAYGDAQREARYLGGISSWVFETSYLSGVISRDVETVLRILRPATALDLIKLDDAAHKPANPVLAAINPVFFAAARLGVEFGIGTLLDAAELRTKLSNISASGATFR
jgi:hypothetical protein